MSKELPFKEEFISDNEVIRTFSCNVDSDDLKWHQDKEDRIIFVINDGGWKIQIENKIPVSLSSLNEISIPKLEWHRVIKGNSNLVVKIKKV